MPFAHPLALLWGLLAIPIVLLYRRSTRMRRQTVATDMFWAEALAAERRRAEWQRWRNRASLALQLLILAILVVALAEPGELVSMGLAVVGVGLLAVEWCLYQRRWTE